MSIEKIIKEYKEKICPGCAYYKNKDYQDCNITMNINYEANCKNYKCKEFCKKSKKKNSFQQLLTM